MTARETGEQTARDYLLTGTILTDGKMLEKQGLIIRHGRIDYVGPLPEIDPTRLTGLIQLHLPEGSYILPGLVDLHCHGAAGGDFPAGHAADSRAAVTFLHRSGTTTLLASLVTASPEQLLSAMSTFRELANVGLIAGIHSEGPFLSASRCGAQDPRWLRNPDLGLLDELMQAAGGHLRTMTYAPELPRSGDLIKMLTGHGVTPSLGHTDASASVAAASLSEAARLLRSSRPTVTHLYNGMPPLHHRSPGPAAASLRLARSGVVAVELVADGEHLDPETVLMTFELVGRENIVLVTDSMAATGLPDGCYELGPATVEVRAAVARLRSNNALAGGTATLLDVLRRTIDAGVRPEDAVLSATAVPAQIIGREGEVGSIRPGLRADVLIVDRNFHRLMVLRDGQVLPPPSL